MKIILTDEVDNLGLPGDVVDVADGYGRNYLLPRGLAMLATPGAMKQAEALTRSRKAREARTVGAAESSKAALEARTLRIPVRVDERGGLYGSVTANDVQRVLKERGHEIPRKRIELKGSIKEIGTYEIPVHVHPMVAATVIVNVVDQDGRLSRDAGGVLVDAEAEPAEPEVVAADDEALKVEELEAAEQFEEQESTEAPAAEAPAEEPEEG